MHNIYLQWWRFSSWGWCV